VFMSSASSYSGGENRRQIGRPQTGLAAALVAILAGCSSLSLPFGPDIGIADTTGAIAVNGGAVDAVAPSDWETVRRTIAAAPPGQAKTMQWMNPATVSTGALTLVPATTAAKFDCRAFSTTISDPRGVRRYRGRACRQGDADWQLTGLAADDTLLS